jgi:leucyl-tRNA synthetase
VIVPKYYLEKYGPDSLRLYLLFLGPFDATMAWNEQALMGVKRFMNRFERFIKSKAGKHKVSGLRVKAVINRLGKEVSEDTASFKFNTAIAHIMETFNAVNDLIEPSSGQAEVIANKELHILTQSLHPMLLHS